MVLAPASEPASAGDPIPRECRIIEVHVTELRQLFNAIDPSPFRERDLDPWAEQFIVGWGSDLPRDSTLALKVYLDRAAGMPDEAVVLREAIHEFFGNRAVAARRNLRDLFQRGRISLGIGLAFLALSLVVGDAFANWRHTSGFTELLRESLLIGGWVAMWRPLEIFLYDWWPIRASARFFDRLAAMPVRIVYRPDVASNAWHSDWPAARLGSRGAPPAT